MRAMTKEPMMEKQKKKQSGSGRVQAADNSSSEGVGRNRGGCGGGCGGCGGGGSSSSSSSGMLGGTSNRRDHQHPMGGARGHRHACCSNGVSAGRLLFLAFLAAVAAAMGFAAYAVVGGSESNLAVESFDAVADRALDEALRVALAKRLGVRAVATAVSYRLPDASSWPNRIDMPGNEFAAVSASVMDVAAAGTMALCPLVAPGQLPEFEQFAYDVALKGKGYPNGTGLRDFDGDGVLEKGVHSYTSDLEMYREVNGTALGWNSPYAVACPFIMHSTAPQILMLNIHSLESVGSVIDEVISCAGSNRTAAKPQEDKEDEGEGAAEVDLNRCAVLSDVIRLWDGGGEAMGPSAMIVQPIYPANDGGVLTGVITSVVKWDDVLARLFPTQVSGVDAVLETGTRTYTYRVEAGRATLRGEGDLHDPVFSEYSRSTDLYSPGLFRYTSAPYTLTLYPTKDMYEVYGTQNPVIATVGSICIIIVTSVLFLVFDFFVRKEFSNKEHLLEAKRRYVRFVSHEVRTPLNTVCMGSQLLQQEMAKFKPSATPQRTIGNGDDPQKDPDASKQIDAYRKVMNKIPEWMELIHDVLTNASGAVNVLSDLLNYDKIENGTLHLELTVIPIWALIKRTADEFHLAAVAKKIKYVVDFNFVCDGATEEPTTSSATSSANGKDLEQGSDAVESLPDGVRDAQVVGDVVRITQVLRNFISNAIKFTPGQGSITVRITWIRPVGKNCEDESDKKEFLLDKGDVVRYSPMGYVQVDVVDSGAGMSEKEAQQVFGEGVQFHVNKLQAGKGSGLGLFISKGITEQHGGYVKASSEGPGHGTTFTVALPLYHVPESALPETLKLQRKASGVRDGDEFGNRQQELATGGETLETFHILVVDDTYLNRKFLVRLLTGKGHSCEEAEHGEEAVDKVKLSLEDGGTPYDVILLDYEMPVMNGPDAARHIRDMGCDSFIAGVTGNLLPEDVNYFKGQGANCVLPKPVHIADLEGRWVEHGLSSSTGAHA